MWRSRTLASQILVGVLVILVVTITLGGLLHVELARRSLDQQYETRAVDIAASVAQIPRSGQGCYTLIPNTSSKTWPARFNGAPAGLHRRR